ncbi:MAG: O-antigen ligase protein [Edaphobacter sp.]|nr:O-antigen ligase protein [Edaphobacter sp.]
MGLFLTLLYILTAYLGPQTVFGPIAEYHIEIIIALMAMVASLPSLQESYVFSLPQAYALIGMCGAVFISFVFNGLTGLAPNALLDFLPNSFTFFFIVLNCKKKRHLQMVILVLLFAALFTIYRGYSALQSGNYLSPYLVGQGNDEGSAIYRLRGLSFISDPNDFSQLIVSLIPCLFFFWRPKSLPRNIILVLVPTGLLLFGMYLTHSRGAIVAFLAVVILAARRKVGTVPSIIIAGVLFAITTAVGWSGGREISVEAGAGRMEAWAVGLDLIKAHPLFGVGFQRFGEYFFITAHNSIVVCAAELGMFGLFFWVMFVIPTIRDAVTASKPVKSKEQEAKEEEEKTPFERALAARAAAEPGMLHLKSTVAVAEPAAGSLTDLSKAKTAANPYFMDIEEDTPHPEEEIRRITRLQTISLAGYLVAGWFLSRAYVMTLFIYGGMVQVMYQMALNQGYAPPRITIPRIMRLSAMAAVGLIIVVYIMLRLQHLMPG